MDRETMDGRWSRRILLAGLATGVAGCSSSNRDTTNTPESTPTEAPSATATPEPTHTATQTPEAPEVRSWPDGYYQGPLVSAHEHMNGPDGYQMRPPLMDWFVEWMTRNRVAQAMAITHPDLASTVEQHDDCLIPFYFPWQAIQQNFSRLAEVIEYMLDTYEIYRGIGEFALYRQSIPDGDPPIPADHPRLLEVYDLAADRDVPVMVHGGDPSQYGNGRDPVAHMEAAFEHNRECTFLVHGTFNGVTIDGESDLFIGEAVDILLDRHPNLYFDISGWIPSPLAYRFNEGPDGSSKVSPEERKSQEWFESKFESEGGLDRYVPRIHRFFGPILQNHSDRVTWGMDASWRWHFNNWAMNAWVDVIRAALGNLTTEDARNVGYRTAAELFDIEVTMPLDPE